MHSRLITSCQTLSQAVAGIANGAAVLSSLHNSMLADLCNVLESYQLIASELAETKEALKKANDELATLKAKPAKTVKEDSIAYGDDIKG